MRIEAEGLVWRVPFILGAHSVQFYIEGRCLKPHNSRKHHLIKRAALEELYFKMNKTFLAGAKFNGEVVHPNEMKPLIEGLAPLLETKNNRFRVWI